MNGFLYTFSSYICIIKKKLLIAASLLISVIGENVECIVSDKSADITWLEDESVHYGSVLSICNSTKFQQRVLQSVDDDEFLVFNFTCKANTNYNQVLTQHYTMTRSFHGLLRQCGITGIRFLN